MAKGSDGLPEPKIVQYHPVTGVPEEFHAFLHKDCDEYKRLKQSTEASTAEATEKMAAASLVRSLHHGIAGRSCSVSSNV
jgi:hypothetical protein